jgi:hypothetical protein
MCSWAHRPCLLQGFPVWGLPNKWVPSVTPVILHCLLAYPAHQLQLPSFFAHSSLPPGQHVSGPLNLSLHPTTLTHLPKQGTCPQILTAPQCPKNHGRAPCHCFRGSLPAHPHPLTTDHVLLPKSNCIPVCAMTPLPMASKILFVSKSNSKVRSVMRPPPRSSESSFVTKRQRSVLQWQWDVCMSFSSIDFSW